MLSLFQLGGVQYGHLNLLHMEPQYHLLINDNSTPLDHFVLALGHGFMTFMCLDKTAAWVIAH